MPLSAPFRAKQDAKRFGPASTAPFVPVAAGGDESAKGYINQYAITIFLIAVGLIVICMSGRRADEPKFKREF